METKFYGLNQSSFFWEIAKKEVQQFSLKTKIRLHFIGHNFVHMVRAKTSKILVSDIVYIHRRKKGCAESALLLNCRTQMLNAKSIQTQRKVKALFFFHKMFLLQSILLFNIQALNYFIPCKLRRFAIAYNQNIAISLCIAIGQF